MTRARSYSEARLCEECGQPIEGGRKNQFLCRRCEQAMERRKRKGERTRRTRRDLRREREFDDW
jgi:predicted amidophosphoribosyltransferase